jgi:hypothetical protein
MADGFKGFLDWIGYPVGKVPSLPEALAGFRGILDWIGFPVARPPVSPEGNAYVTGVEGVGEVGDAYAVQVESFGTADRFRRRRRRVIPAYAHVEGLQASGTLGQVRATGAAVASGSSCEGLGGVGPVRVDGAAVALAGSVEGFGIVGVATGSGAAVIGIVGIRGEGRLPAELTGAAGDFRYTYEELVIILEEAA